MARNEVTKYPCNKAIRITQEQLNYVLQKAKESRTNFNEEIRRLIDADMQVGTSAVIRRVLEDEGLKGKIVVVLEPK